jgi:hypothetical protein
MSSAAQKWKLNSHSCGPVFPYREMNTWYDSEGRGPFPYGAGLSRYISGILCDREVPLSAPLVSNLLSTLEREGHPEEVSRTVNNIASGLLREEYSSDFVLEGPLQFREVDGQQSVYWLALHD